MTIRLMLADDHRMFREALRGPLSAEPDMEVIAEAGTGAEVRSVLARTQPDVLLLDIALPDVSGIEIAREVTKRYPLVRILALSGHADRIYVEEMLRSGARGYVLKAAGGGELIAGIRAVASGRGFLCSEVTRLMMPQMIDDDTRSATPPLSVLGKREREVLRLLAQGKRSAEIAAMLGISSSTADVHRRNIKRKLGLFTTADLTRYAIHEGLCSS
ncbi:MAG: response regulator transcription factor [Alphaproteobacteria bacterium]|nr:response regulator transcription factor [Alphaproteobacteria bacterium]MBF0130076.1 response regulator transcription factor [Alphaproteobacteria bacterium]